jgi:hypothetical protein
MGQEAQPGGLALFCGNAFSPYCWSRADASVLLSPSAVELIFAGFRQRFVDNKDVQVFLFSSFLPQVLFRNHLAFM